jgi:hypothetical protein
MMPVSACERYSKTVTSRQLRVQCARVQYVHHLVLALRYGICLNNSSVLCKCLNHQLSQKGSVQYSNLKGPMLVA